jgi:predicted nucleotidyltransferase
MKQDLKPLSEVLQKQSSVIFAYLFGSKIKGYANTRSDWDIAVYFSEPMDEIGHWPAFDLEAKLARAVGGIVQVTVLNELLAPLFGFEIVKDGIVLIDRDQKFRMEFENRILRYYHDWQYFLKRQMKAEGYLSTH